jgi:endonuclease-8
MEGSWRIGPPTSFPRRDYRIRLILANQQWQAVGMLLGIVEVIRTSREDAAIGHLGPDLLGPDFDADEAVRRMRADPRRTIGEALLDQRNLAGIGTIYRAETLFLRGVSPWRPVGAIADLHELVELARRLLDANKDRVGTVTTGDRARLAQVWVYGRAGQPCRRCGTPIRRSELGPALEERTVVWCPRCQPA